MKSPDVYLKESPYEVTFEGKPEVTSYESFVPLVWILGISVFKNLFLLNIRVHPGDLVPVENIGHQLGVACGQLLGHHSSCGIKM